MPRRGLEIKPEEAGSDEIKVIGEEEGPGTARKSDEFESPKLNLKLEKQDQK